MLPLPPDRIKTRLIDRVSFASDAGFYYMVPEAVVQPIDEEEIKALFAYSQKHRIPIVFRTGGTSLSGQSITNGILVDLSQFWRNIRVEENGALVRVQPGITGSMVNAHLKKYGRKIGPDPSSISAAMMGGILSNNASGMCCGVALNSYHTTKHIRFILPCGLSFHTEDPNEALRFEKECPEIFRELTLIRDQIHRDAVLLTRIREKYQTKNTVGYSLNAFVDHKHPLDILAHLLIGAEGTLAFIAEAVMHTVPDHPFKSTTLLYFPNIRAACEAILPLKTAGAEMVELMDRASLRSVEDLKGMPAIVKELPSEAAALLIEFQEASAALLAQKVNGFLQEISSYELLNAPVFTEDPEEREFLWKVRKGLFPAVGSVRASGTTVILEDIAFPLPVLGNAITDLQQLFQKYQYDNAIIFGHAKDGNIHFVVTQSFNTSAEIDRYDRFIREVVELVVNRYDGTLKAEHGTGRNMAPFVETEWGPEAYDILRRIKRVVDPEGLLNPGVIINENGAAHIEHLKKMPSVEEEVDKCIECGYCEPLCPSRDLTTSPRRRIVVRRVLKDLQSKGDHKNYETLLKEFQYDGLDTCAVDGLCATACPVDINTGDLVKRLRRENHSVRSNEMALWVAKHFLLVERTVRFALGTGHLMNRLFGKRTMWRITNGLRKLFPSLPSWSGQLMVAPDLSALKNRSKEPQESSDNTVVYLPACISRVMGSYQGKQKNLTETFLSICDKTGFAVHIPSELEGSCCSQIFSSKGFSAAQQFTANRVIENLWQATAQGKYPVVIDVSSCAYTLHQIRPVLNDSNKKCFDALRIMDAVDFIHDAILPKASSVMRSGSVVLHPVCALTKMGTGKKFEAIAKHFAESVTVPMAAGCCGMAGDRGFLYPEFTASATSAESKEVAPHSFDAYYSSTRTCEMALSESVKQEYVSILYLVDEAL